MWTQEQMDLTQTIITHHILNDWPRDRIERFALHLMGDKCQECAAIWRERKKMKTQLEYLKEAVKLAEQNPELGIVIAADSSELIEDYTWTKHRITSVGISYYHERDEKIITDVDDMIDDMAGDLDRDVTEEEAIKEMIKVILVSTGAN